VTDGCSAGWEKTYSRVNARPAGHPDALPQQRHPRAADAAFADDKPDDTGTFISQGLGHQSYSPTYDQAAPQRLRQDLAVVDGAGPGDHLLMR
jgi:hypothetical protein